MSLNSVRVLIAACCAGAAEGLVPVIRKLLEDGDKVRVIGVDKKQSIESKFNGSAEIFAKNQIEFIELNTILQGESPFNISDNLLRLLIKEYNPDFILVGTSRDTNGIHKGIEEGLIINGSLFGIHVTQFVDSWEAWYPRKFIGYEAAAYVVPDQITQNLLYIRGGIDKSKVFITGHPGWEEFLRRYNQDERRYYRQEMGLQEKNRLFVYYGSVTSDDPKTLGWVINHLRNNDRLVFRHHFRDSRDYTDILKQDLNRVLEVDLDSDALLSCADICLTHHGAMGVKAVLAGIPTINFILPGDCDQLCEECGGFPLSLLGGSIQVGTESEYQNVLENIGLPDREELKKRLNLDGLATQRILNILKNRKSGDIRHRIQK